MGGFVGGVVRADRQLAPSEFQNIVTSIQRRGAGTAFQRVLYPQDLGVGKTCDSIVYLASAQEPGFAENGALSGEPPILKSVSLIDGFPAERSISELENETASQRTVLPHGGPEFVARLSSDAGPFAFASLDPESNKLTVGRDLLGRKTVYYYETDGEFWFSTDLPALLSVRGVPRRPNPAEVYEYLRHGSWNTTDQTLFADVAQFPPGTILDLDLQNPGIYTLREARTFEIPEIVSVNYDDAVATTREAFLKSIEQCIPQNQFPIGATLSGGTDSSSIVTAMRHVAGVDREIHTFSFITPDHNAINEERWIDIAAKAAGSVSHKVEVSSNEYANGLSHVTRELGEPLLGISQFLQFRLGQVANDVGIRNLLDGISGDPITGGHEYQVFDRLRRSVSDRDIRTSIALTKTIVGHILAKPTRSYIVQALSQLPDPLHKAIRSMARLEAMPAWMDEAWFAANDVYGTLPKAAKGRHPYQEHVISTVTESRTIRVAERNAAVNQANSRMPFLDTQFIEHMLQLPEQLSFGNNGQHRVAFAAAMQPFVPEEIFQRTVKIGFKAPDNHWLDEQRDWANQVLARGSELNMPIRLEQIPADIKEQKVNRYDIVRCLNLATWADNNQVQF